MPDPAAKLDGLTFQEALEILKMELARGNDKSLILSQLHELQGRLDSITDAQSQHYLRRQYHELLRQSSE